MKRRVILVDPKTRQVAQIFKDIDEVCEKLEFQKNQLSHCLNNKHVCVKNLILKYEEHLNPENLNMWCDNLSRALDGTIRCVDCKSWKNTDQFKNSHGLNCVNCERKRLSKYKETPIGFFKNLIGTMKLSTSQKQQKGRDICDNDITFQDLIDLYAEQNGKCYYTGIRLNLGQLVDWKCSPERLDNNIGYTIDNVKLICLEFNNSNGHWTKDKILSLKTMPNVKFDFDKLYEQIENAFVITRSTTHKKQKEKSLLRT